MYVLNLAEDGRILSTGKRIENVDYGNMVIVDTLPEGNPRNYKYNNNEYVYDPLPEPEPKEPEPTTDEILDVLLGIGGEA